MEEKIKIVNPKTAKPATPNPITVPPPKKLLRLEANSYVRLGSSNIIFFGCDFHSHISSQSRKKCSKKRQQQLKYV
jgi:hypothetical protein